MSIAGIAIFVGVLSGLKVATDVWISDRRKQRRKQYYNEYYLDSDAWQRKRALVLNRDRHKCVYCGGRATQVHHKRYGRRNIGREPIEWLVSVCASCHKKQHASQN